MHRSSYVIVLTLLIFVAGACTEAPVDEPGVLFDDSFDGQLGEGWTWLREDPDTWRFRDGGMEIRHEPGNAHTVKNVLLRPLPDRRGPTLAVEVTVTYLTPPTNQYQQAGFTVYQEGEPALKLVHELIDGAMYVFPGDVPTTSNTVQLQLVLSEDEYEGRFREDGEGEWVTATTGDLPFAASEQISILAYAGPPDVEHWVRFENFRIRELDA